MNILFQFPTKGRCEKFFETLDLYYKNISDISKCKFHIVIDHFDYSMNNSTTLHKLSSYENLFVSAMPEKETKINACNFKIDRFGEWFDIIVLVSDDMIPIAFGIDKIIQSAMGKHYPSTDGCLWFNDGYTKNKLCTLCVLGAKYYKRFNYIYNPEYKSLWADNEFTIVARKLNKITYYSDTIIRHEHPINNENVQSDDIYLYNNSLGADDNKVFEKRRLINFGL